MKIGITSVSFIVSVLFSAPAQAVLVDNLDGTITQIKTDGSTLMWIQDASLSGQLNWDDAVLWADNLIFAGYDDWRLPDSPGTAQGFINEGELGYLFYTELGNTAWSNVFPSPIPLNTGPFLNVELGGTFHLGTPPLSPLASWEFAFNNPFRGFQNSGSRGDTNHAWVVRNVPDTGSTALLLGAGLLGLAGLRRRMGRS